jgi:hypothetical protein
MTNTYAKGMWKYYILQVHVTHIRLGHRRLKKNENWLKKTLLGGKKTLMQLLSPCVVKVLWKRHAIVRKFMQVKLPKSCKESCTKCNLNILWAIKTKCRNCQFMVVRRGVSVVLYKEGCEDILILVG